MCEGFVVGCFGGGGQAIRHVPALEAYFTTTAPVARGLPNTGGEMMGEGGADAGAGAEEAFLYQWDLNLESPFGAGGQLAVALADLMLECREAETAGQRAVRPRGFKAALAAFDRRFAGYQQQVRVWVARIMGVER